MGKDLYESENDEVELETKDAKFYFAKADRSEANGCKCAWCWKEITWEETPNCVEIDCHLPPSEDTGDWEIKAIEFYHRKCFNQKLIKSLPNTSHRTSPETKAIFVQFWNSSSVKKWVIAEQKRLELRKKEPHITYGEVASIDGSLLTLRKLRIKLGD